MHGPAAPAALPSLWARSGVQAVHSAPHRTELQVARLRQLPHTRHVHHLLLHHHLLRRPRQFPLDSDDILIRVGPKEYTDQDVVLEIDAKKHGTEGASGDRIKSSNLEEWELGNPSVRIERSGPTGSGNYYSNVVFCVCVA